MARILRGSGKRSGVRKDLGVPGGLDRRSVLKAGGLLGAAAILTSNKAAFAQTSGGPTPPVLCGIDPPIKSGNDAVPRYAAGAAAGMAGVAEPVAHRGGEHSGR